MIIQSLSAPVAPVAHPAISWGTELRESFALAWPLVIAQLAQNALLTTDVIMMGWLGPEYLAAGALAISYLNTFLIGGIGLVGAVAPLVAQALGAREIKGVRRTVRQGLWVGIALALLLIPVTLAGGPILTLLGQDAAVVARAQTFFNVGCLIYLPALALIVLRSFLSALGEARIILYITIAGIVVNATSNWLLMFGHFGFPRLELTGAAISTTLVNTAMFGLMALYLTTHWRYRRYHVFARFLKPDWSRFFSILRIGGPVGLMLLAEVGIFTAAAILMGLLGTNELAAHAIALQLAAIAFMVPLGFSQAVAVRVGRAYGRGDTDGIRKAGWVALALGVGFMTVTALLFMVMPGPLVGLFLDRANPESAQTLTLAASFLVVAGLFQIFDGAQVVGGAALRGLSDTTVPMVIAIVGYWAIGFPVAYLLGFVAGLRGPGIWLGLAVGLAIVAVVLCIRFAMRDRLGLTRPRPYTVPTTH
jgi:MATE family multidrug resistance protein